MSEDFDPDLEEYNEPDDGTENFIDEESALTSAEELASRVRRLVELRTTKEETNLTAKKAAKDFDEYQAAFFEEYERSPLKGSIRIDIGGDHGTVQIVPRKTKYGRVLDYDKAMKYFKERNKLDEFTRDDFRMGRLHEMVREYIEQKKPLPEGIDFYTKEYFTITFKG